MYSKSKLNLKRKMKEFFEKYLTIINEDINISSKYVDKKYFGTIDHNDIFFTSSFFNTFPNDPVLIDQFVNKFIAMANVKNIKNDKEYLIYDQDKKITVFVDVYVKGSFRHDIILGVSFSTPSCPTIQKTGQTRIIF